MRTTSETKIRDYRERNWWGDTRIHDLFDANAHEHPARIAIVDLSGGWHRQKDVKNYNEMRTRFNI